MGRQRGGKSSACHLLLRKYNMWPHTAEDLQSNVKVNGRAPKISHTMKRLVMLKPRGRAEVFFWTTCCRRACTTRRGEGDRQLSFERRLSTVGPAIVELDNLYARECREFRRPEPGEAQEQGQGHCRHGGTVWPVPDEKIRSLLRQLGMRNEGALTRGVQVCHGDARQAVVFANMEKTGIRCASAADLRSNVFDACRAALDGDAAHALAAGDVQMLQALVQHNYPFQFVSEKSVWGNASKKELAALEAMSGHGGRFLRPLLPSTGGGHDGVPCLCERGEEAPAEQACVQVAVQPHVPARHSRNAGVPVQLSAADGVLRGQHGGGEHYAGRSVPRTRRRYGDDRTASTSPPSSTAQKPLRKALRVVPGSA